MNSKLISIAKIAKSSIRIFTSCQTQAAKTAIPHAKEIYLLNLRYQSKQASSSPKENPASSQLQSVVI